MRRPAARHLVGSTLGRVALALSAGAHAEETAPKWGDRRVVVEGVAGLGTPVGSLGIIGRVEPVPWMSIGGGVGRGLLQTEYGGLVLFRIPIRRAPTPLLAATVDTGYSVGEGHTFRR